MKTIHQLKEKRLLAGISGRLLCAKAKVDRGRLSSLERGYFSPSAEELARLEDALAELLMAKQKVVEVATECGWPISGL